MAQYLFPLTRCKWTKCKMNDLQQSTSKHNLCNNQNVHTGATPIKPTSKRDQSLFQDHISDPTLPTSMLVHINWCFEPSQPLRIISGLKETFIKRHIVERTKKAEIRTEQNEKS